VTALRLFSQLTGPVKWSLQGFAPCSLGHVASVLDGSMLQPGAARALTWTETSTFCRVSTLTAIGAGVSTCTSWIKGFAVTFSFTAEPGSARVASTDAMRLLSFT